MRRALILLCAVLPALISGGCMAGEVPREVSLYQNGKNLGVWNVKMDLASGEARLRNGKRLIILPAEGIDVGSLYFRRGGLVVAGRR